MSGRRAAVVTLLTSVLAGCNGASGPPGGEATGAPAEATATAAPAVAACAAADLPTSGTTLSPTDFGDGFAGFFDEAAELGPVLGWGGSIDQIADPEGAPRLVAGLCDEHDHATFIQTSPFRQHEPGFAVPFEGADRARLLDDLVTLVADHPIAFLAVGVEVNFWRERTTAADWDAYVAWYGEVYEAVKERSPSTLVFPTFQYERMVGEHGGLWGPDEAPGTQWDALDDLPDRDLTAFTSYPHLVRPDPADIEDDYWAPITEHTDGPIAFTELGWPARDVAPGWESDPEEQARYVDRLFDVAPAAELYIWPFLYDQDVPAPFDSMGLRDDDGTPRPALERWAATAP